MAIVLTKPEAPPWLKIGFFGSTGTGKTWTAAKVLSQFIAEFCPGKQLAMFDTEPSAGYIQPMVKQITGKDLLAVNSRSFSDLLDFCDIVLKEGHVALLDSATHPWRSLVNDCLAAKRSRVQAAGGNAETARLSLKDWGPVKEIWAKFTEHFVYDPVHWCMNGREGDVWEDVEDDEGKSEMKKTGVKMKTETETGYEPSLLVQMRLLGAEHLAFVCKDRFDTLTGKLSGNNPDIEFFRPHFQMLNIGGKQAQPSAGKPVFQQGKGPNWETIKARRDAVLENIKDDILLKLPGRTAAEQKAKVELLRQAFGTSSWTELEGDIHAFPQQRLEDGRAKLLDLLDKLEPLKKGKDNAEND